MTASDHTIDVRQALTRRWFFRDCAVGLGSMALASLLGESASSAPADPMAPKKPPLPAKAKAVIYLFMAGDPSHLELFDYKPQLAKFDGKLPPKDLIKNYRAAFINPSSTFLGPKFKFAKHGKCGAELGELLPHLGRVVDDIAIVKSMVTDAFNHAPAQILMNTGSQLFGRPSMGSWTTYGLGSESKDLPGFVVFSSGLKGPSGGQSNWGSGFLPTVHNGVLFRSAGDPVLFLSNPAGIDAKTQRHSLDAIKALNEKRLGVTGDPEIATRISSFEMAYRMQSSTGTHGPFQGIEEDARHVWGRAGQAVVRQQLSIGSAIGRARRSLCAALPRGVGSSRRIDQRAQERMQKDGSTSGRPDP